MVPVRLPVLVVFAFTATALAARAQQSAGEAAFEPPPTFEMLSWVEPDSSNKVRVDCTVTGGAAACKGTTADKTFVFDQRGNFSGPNFAYETAMTYTGQSPNGCSITIEFHSSGSATFKGDGTLTWSHGGGAGRVVRASPACGDVSKPYPFPATSGIGTWRALSEASGSGFGDALIKTAVWNRLGIAEGPLARRCFDDAITKLNEPRNREIKERIASAAYRQHMIAVAVEAAKADDFTGNWGAVADKLKPSGSLKDLGWDQITKRLPPPLDLLYEIGDKTHAVSSGINESIAGPYMKGQLYEQYIGVKLETPNVGHVQQIKDAGTRTGVWAKLTTDLAPRFPGATPDAKLAAMARYLGTRFDFIQKVREVADNRERLTAEAWRDAENDIARVKMSVLDCMAR